MRIIRFLFLLFIVGTSFVLGAFFFISHNKVIDFSALEHYNPGRPSILLDDEGNEWGRFQLDRREPIAYKAMPGHLINAFIATEDWSFFKHPGIALKGLFDKRDKDADPDAPGSWHPIRLIR